MIRKYYIFFAYACQGVCLSVCLCVCGFAYKPIVLPCVSCCNTVGLHCVYSSSLLCTCMCVSVCVIVRVYPHSVLAFRCLLLCVLCAGDEGTGVVRPVLQTCNNQYWYFFLLSVCFLKLDNLRRSQLERKRRGEDRVIEQRQRSSELWELGMRTGEARSCVLWIVLEFSKQRVMIVCVW